MAGETIKHFDFAIASDMRMGALENTFRVKRMRDSLLKNLRFSCKSHETHGENWKSRRMSRNERSYRFWCAENRLFLNPHNDISSEEWVCRDTIMLSGIVEKIDTDRDYLAFRPPAIIRYYCQMIQEFISARWLLWSGIHEDKRHYSDKHVSLVNSYDYGLFNIRIEKIKNAYRMAYSIFDKISFFLYKYLSIEMNEKKVTFKNVWRHKKGKMNTAIFEPLNYAFMALYRLSQDVSESDASKVALPDSQLFYTVRNQIEHKFLQISDSFSQGIDYIESLPDKAEYIYASDFADKTIRLLKSVRAAIMYLKLGVTYRENILTTDSETYGLMMLAEHNR